MTDANDTEIDIVENRSEIVFLYDCQRCNPNGNPLDDSNRPRIDAQTQRAIVTDVRLKRYLRDQFDADGLGVYVSKPNDGAAPVRENLLEDRVSVTSESEVTEDVLDEFLANSIDVRLFGAVLSYDTSDDLIEAIDEQFPSNFTGPLQFSPGRSMHPVELNNESDSLTSIIHTGEGKEQGGFDLDDKRVKYALMKFHGILNENTAEDTHLAPEDVERVDTGLWRALKNQTNSRSKTGQEPRFYLRAEYDDDNYHIGGLHDYLTLDDDASKPAEELRSITDTAVDASDLLDRLERSADAIDTIHVTVSDQLTITGHDGDADDHTAFYDALRNAVGDDSVHVIDVREESPAV